MNAAAPLERVAVPDERPRVPPRLEAYGITKRFGALTVLDGAGLRLGPGDFHALLGGNGAGKSTLVKCIMGYYRADAGSVLIGDREVEIATPREALRLGLGMVYQHFTLVPSMSVLENLVLARAEIPMVLHWRREERALAALMARMPFRVDLGAPVHSLSAGEKQKVEILKQLFLERRIVILDEPTSVLTPDESDEVLGMLHRMTRDGVLSVLLITHKFREVMRFAGSYTVLRNGKVTGSGAVREVSPKHLAELMIGNEDIAAPAERATGEPGETRLEVRGLSLHNERGVPAVRDLSFSIRAGEILGIAGVSGNGQRELVEVLSGSRARIAGRITAHGAPYRATRREMRRHGVYCLAEEPLKNACVPGMSVAENMALRSFDRAPMSVRGLWLRRSALTSHAQQLIERFGVKPPLPEARIEMLSGGNVQRAVLARELSEEVRVLIAANPCFGLDFAATAAIRAKIMEARNRGAAVLLISEDLDEVFDLADRIAVMFEGRFVYEAPAATADRAAVGRAMAGH